MGQPQPTDPATLATDAGPIPEDNLPGHHPDVEQDKPTRPPKPKSRPPKSTAPKVPDPARFEFAFDGTIGPWAKVVGVRPDNSYVEVAGERVTIRFGPWVVETSRGNVTGADVTGPYAWWKVAGPPHLSFIDRGLTMATSTDKGVCIRFRRPVKGIEPVGVLRHRGVTVTPRDPERLIEALTR
jgi:hypothetical protein